MKRHLLIAFIILFTIAAHAQNRNSESIAGTQTGVLRFYPNPATTAITFDFQKDYDKGYSLQIYNAMLGRKMIEQINIPNKLILDLTNFIRGVYVYQLRDKNNNLVEIGKFQVSK